MALLIGRLRAWSARAAWLLARLGQAGGGRAIGVLTVWLAWERLTTWRAGLRPVQPGSILHYCRRVYTGRPIVLRDGTPVRPGDRILELHFDNRTLLRRSTSPERLPWSTMRLVADDLDALARLAREGELEGVMALHGVSLLARVSRRLGFEFRPLPRTPDWSLVHFYLVGLAAIYHPHGWRGAGYLRDTGWPGELWLSVGELRQRRTPPAPQT